MSYRSLLLSLTLAIGSMIIAQQVRAQACSDDSTRYVRDSRTYGIWYMRGRFDSALNFPRLLDTITTCTSRAPQIYQVGIPGTNKLYWFDGILNHLIGSGSASTPNLQQVTTVGNSSTKGILLTDSTVAAGGYIWTWGNSVTVGFDATIPATEGYAPLTAMYMQATQVPKGISGTTMQQISAGDSSFQNRLYTVPTWVPNIRYITIDYGINDCDLGYTLSGFIAAYSTCLHTILTTLGYPASRVLLIAPTLIGHNSFGKGPADLLPFAHAVDSIANANGTLLFDAFTYMVANGGSSLISSDSIHPTTYGHFIIARGLQFAAGQSPLEVDGVSYLTQINSFDSLVLNNQVTKATGILRQQNAAGQSDILTAAPFGAGNVRTTITGGDSPSDGSYVVTVGSNQGPISLAGIETATSLNADGTYGAGNVGVTIYTSGANSYLRTYTGNEDFATGGPFIFPNQDGTTNMLINPTTDQLLINGSAASGFNVGIEGSVLIGDGATRAPGLTLAFPPLVTLPSSSYFPLVIDGSGLVNYGSMYGSGGLLNAVHNVQTPSTGGSVTMTANQYNIINPAGGIATLTITLPSSASNGDFIEIKITQSIAAITWTTLQPYINPPTSTTGSTYIKLVYDAGTTSWY